MRTKPAHTRHQHEQPADGAHASYKQRQAIRRQTDPGAEWQLPIPQCGIRNERAQRKVDDADEYPRNG
jgi:hypothetical protein